MSEQKLSLGGKATPGPWKIEPGEKRGAWIGNGEEWSALACGITDEVARANAHLIAALKAIALAKTEGGV